MSTTDPQLALFSTHDLKLGCAECCVKEKEITYTLKSVHHRCARDILLCRSKDGKKWRPVSKQPAFPNPSQYMVCFYFEEGFGCKKHKNRCTFARSDEEAAVWNFIKHQRLDHTFLCNLILKSETQCAQPIKTESLEDLLQNLDLKPVCDLCCVKENEITYTVETSSHQCGRNLLLVKAKASNQWRPVSERPKSGNFGKNVMYDVCNFFSEKSGCSRHGQGCTYARSFEEATVWNFMRDKNLDQKKLISLVTEAEPLVTPESTAESILQKFSGNFIEFCKDCFHQRPQKITAKRWNDTCSAEVAHKWNPVLVHHLAESQRKVVYSQIRPLSQHCKFQYCNHVREGKPCWHEAGHCSSAQSEVEMAVWKAEQSGLFVRPHLLQLSLEKQIHPGQDTIYCKVCLLVLSTPESFYKHCSSMEHAQLLSEDTTIRWRGRPPPHNRRADFWLCERPQTCEYGETCPRAHSEEELQEWMMRVAEEKEIRQNIEAQGLMSYNERLLEEYKNSSNEVYIISDQVDDVSVTCDEDLMVECEQINTTLQWNFQVDTERELLHVALLKQEPGASFSLGDINSEPSISSAGEHFRNESMTYDVTVSFTSINPGLYEQWLVMDFGLRPVLLQKLRVRVGQSTFDDADQPAKNSGATFQSAERWHSGNRAIVPSLRRTEEQEELLKEYKPPQISFLYKHSHNHKTSLNHDNYKERMHHFLYNEERAEDKVVSRLNVCGEITTMEILQNIQFGIKIAPQGELFCAVCIPCNLTPDTPEGLVLRRSIQSGLIAPLSSRDRNCKVYEAIIHQDTINENTMCLQLSKKCCSDLALKSNESHQMEVQFQLNRQRFCAMHKAVDLLSDTKRVLPDLKKCGVPVYNIRCEKLNAKQQSAVDFIMGTSDARRFVAPLLIYGPFGTGKTFTLATAAKELCKQCQNKVLICTHTNSSADLYIREHFHQFIEKQHSKMRPVRIKYNKQGAALSATDEITLQYCLLSKNKQYFLPPTKAALDQHNVVVTTTTMARHFYELNLPEGYFSHILIDEASQMLECEALMPLGLAGPNTRVALAGDHMQMGPKLFSVDDHNRSNHTLLNRLFHYYQDQPCDAAHNSRIIFSENYRSTKEIVDFVSTYFYVAKNDVIKAAGNIPPHPDGHALKFHHVRGECLLDNISMSWFNNEEVVKVVEAVQEILQHWPSTWGTKDHSTICILSEGAQVRQIRKVLLRRNLGNVHVENLANVQGKQFRAVIMTAVQTRDSLKTSHLPGLELFNDARVLNTAMTRAQSQVVVIGDAAALCCFGKCSRIWKSYIDHCISKQSTAPEHFTKHFFEKDVMETARFQKLECVDESNSHDTILQELRYEFEQEQPNYSSDEDSLEVKDRDCCKTGLPFKNGEVCTDLLELCKKQPDMYKHGKLVRESYNRGYVVPFDNPTRRITMNGRASFSKAFTGDEVILFEMARVMCITKESESARVLVCVLEDEDHSKPRRSSPHMFFNRTMVPITKSAPKICIHISKKKRNFIPVWKQIDGHWMIENFLHLNEDLKQNHVFKVQVIGWKEECLFPLGNVIDVIPIGKSLDDAIKILHDQFKVLPSQVSPGKQFSSVDDDGKFRFNMRDVITFTVDPENAKDLDDAVSVKDAGDHYELGVHIADVASFVSKGDDLDEDAKQRGATYYGGETIHMFPKEYSTGTFSLLSGRDRRVVSLMINVEKETHEIIGKPRFQLSWINSNRQLSYEEAEDIISERYRNRLTFDTVEDCATVAYCFAKAQRKKRLADWPYVQSDEYRLPGKRKAHVMIEELSVLFNTRASDELIHTDKSSYYTPLRCQEKPDPEKITEFKDKCAQHIPLSFHVRHRLDHDGESPNDGKFRILTNVWTDIQSAARTGDIDKMVDMVAADDIHPLLQPVINQFRKCSSKAYVIRSKSSRKAEVGHYSLNVPSYTQASSPIRRYMDIVLQRLLHSIICDKGIQYNRREINILCSQFEKNLKDAKDYEQKAEKISYAVSMKKQNASKVVIIVSADPEGDSFAVSFPFNKSIFSDSLSIMYNDLQLEDQPLHDPETQCITLKWRRRIYAADNMQIHQELKMLLSCNSIIEVPLTTWKATVEAIDKENWDDAKLCIMKAQTNQLERHQILPEICQTPQTEMSTSEEYHYVDINLQIQPGDTLQIQMTSEVQRGFYTPTIQLVCINPKFEICVDHVHSPITCFSRCANNPSRADYRDTNEYVRIWRPLCEMESAAVAVDQSDSIIIENLAVDFQQEQEHILTGSFILLPPWIDEWAIDFKLDKCLLCIRKRGLKMTSTPEHSALVDPKEFTWVAHGVTRKVEEVKPPNEHKKVEFYINHLPMETLPDCIFQKNTCFTVEIIPKLVPDIRKEAAVLNINSACDLVKCIALGHHIPRQVVQYSVVRWDIMRQPLPSGLPKLNDRQYEAVEKALNNTFTLIQGPPGTGKTIVGVQIVYSFFKQNAKYKRRCVHPKDKNKKEVILYCGPSNKSVDVVGEYLLKFEDMRPLRVYSEQVEMIEYPYPNCTLPFSSRALRQEPSKPELRSITLHHRIRQSQNPHSEEIKTFDAAIKAALEKGEKMTHGDVKAYKQLLRRARQYEIERHDVILCTCTQSSTPGLALLVSARQILIDECAMATEPQAVIPLVCNNPEKIVLIGDHKQLRPIVKNYKVRKLGMARSLFERYYTMHEKSTVMLEIQYRMHEDICEFPSKQYYEGKLKTGVEQPNSVLRVNNKPMQIVFGDIRGKTISLVVNTSTGNMHSKKNNEERDKVVEIVKMLVKKAKIKQRDIVILSPYNAQVSEMKKKLNGLKITDVTVTTITKSQGSEWRYVIISTVCSLPSEEIEKEPDGSWLSKNLGSVGDPNQTNVAITRAKEGLCIIGNQELLNCSGTWKKLLDHYKSHNAVTDANNISVHSVEDS